MRRTLRPAFAALAVLSAFSMTAPRQRRRAAEKAPILQDQRNRRLANSGERSEQGPHRNRRPHHHRLPTDRYPLRMQQRENAECQAARLDRRQLGHERRAVRMVLVRAGGNGTPCVGPFPRAQPTAPGARLVYSDSERTWGHRHGHHYPRRQAPRFNHSVAFSGSGCRLTRTDRREGRSPANCGAAVKRSKSEKNPRKRPNSKCVSQASRSKTLGSEVTGALVESHAACENRSRRRRQDRRRS